RRVLAHAEIVVAAPDGDLGGRIGAAGRAWIVERPGELAGFALELGEVAIAPLRLERGDALAEELLVIHRRRRHAASPMPSLRTQSNVSSSARAKRAKSSAISASSMIS